MSANSEQGRQSGSRSVFVIGATGGVGRRLTTLLHQQGREVTGMHRSEHQGAAIRDAGGTPVRGDLVADSVEDLATLMAGHDAIVFSAGAGCGAEQTAAVDEEGAKKAAGAAAVAGVRRLVLVSVFMDAWRGSASPGTGFEQYMEAKRAADVHVAGTDLDWLIVRPGTLVNTSGTGLVNAGIAISYGDIPRDDVAAFIAASMFTPILNRTAIELTAGDVPIDEAIARLRSRSWQSCASNV